MIGDNDNNTNENVVLSLEIYKDGNIKLNSTLDTESCVKCLNNIATYLIFNRLKEISESKIKPVKYSFDGIKSVS